jgi:NAD(P)-dependent dehydrogenase (short-subunit alcohol dehydrogenase family)
MSTEDPVTDRTILITGANRGLGRALVEEALRRGARRVFAGTRVPLTHPDVRVIPLPLDITDAAQIEAAVQHVEELDVLVNNAGLAIYGELADQRALERQIAVNLFGTYSMTHAFGKRLISAGGTVVNVLSLAAIAPVPVIPAYSVSKAAAFSLTQAMRMTLAEQDVRVHAVLSGPLDTDMTREPPFAKTPPHEATRAIFDGVAAGTEDIFPDPWSAPHWPRRGRPDRPSAWSERMPPCSRPWTEPRCAHGGDVTVTGVGASRADENSLSASAKGGHPRRRAASAVPLSPTGDSYQGPKAAAALSRNSVTWEMS